MTLSRVTDLWLLLWWDSGKPSGSTHSAAAAISHWTIGSRSKHSQHQTAGMPLRQTSPSPASHQAPCRTNGICHTHGYYIGWSALLSLEKGDNKCKKWYQKYIQNFEGEKEEARVLTQFTLQAFFILSSSQLAGEPLKAASIASRGKGSHTKLTICVANSFLHCNWAALVVGRLDGTSSKSSMAHSLRASIMVHASEKNWNRITRLYNWDHCAPTCTKSAVALTDARVLAFTPRWWKACFSWYNVLGSAALLPSIEVEVHDIL